MSEPEPDDFCFEETMLTTNWAMVEGVNPWKWILSDTGAWDAPHHEFAGLREHFVKHVKGRRAIIQAGGCLGMYPRLWANSFDNVYTFEPDALNFHCLVHNCQSSRIIKFQAALGAKNGWATLDRRSEVNVGIHRMKWEPGRVPIIAIDEMRFTELDAIQLDCEGSEPQILAGAAKTIKRLRPVISVETVDGRNVDSEIVERMRLAQYEEVGRNGLDVIYAPR